MVGDGFLLVDDILPATVVFLVGVVLSVDEDFAYRYVRRTEMPIQTMVLGSTSFPIELTITITNLFFWI